MLISRLITAVTSTALVAVIQSNSPIASSDSTTRYSANNLKLSSPALANPPAKAKPKFRYVPPSRRPPKSTQATGSRGCEQSQLSQPVTLTLLAPNDHDGLTTSGHPTFFWHISAPVTMAFALTERGVVQPLLEQQIEPPAAGIVELKMPPNSPELVPGREYRWSVTLMCNPDRPSANPFIHTWIERTAPTPELNQQLAAAANDQERAAIYARSGLWYDALAAISAAYEANPNDQVVLAERLSLLEEVGLTQVATQERQRSVTVPK